MPNLCGTGLQKLKQSVIFAQARSLTADIPGIERHLTKLNMKNYSLRLISLCLAGWGTLTTYAQTYSSSSNLTAQPTADRVVPYTYGERFRHEMRHCSLRLIPGEDHGFSANTAYAASLASEWLVKKLR